MHSVRAKLDWFKAVILPHEAALRGRVKQLLPKRTGLDDLVAEAMTRAYATTDFARITQGRAYLFQIARNLVIDEVRREKVVSFEQLGEIELIAADASTIAQLEARDALRRLEAIIDTLPIQCRRAFILRRVHDKPVAEIAEEMGLSVSTVDKHIGRATMKVMQALGQVEDFEFGRSLQERGTTHSHRGRGGAPVS